MLEIEDNFYPYTITVITNNQKLIREVNEFGKKLEKEHIEDKKNRPDMYEDGLLSDYYPIVNANNDKEAELVIVANDIDTCIPDRNNYNILFYNGNKIDGFDSYINCDNYTEAIMDILRLAFEFGLICIDINDIVKFIYNKNINYNRYTFDSPIPINKIKELVNANKKCISILYGSKNLSLTEIDEIIDAFNIEGNYFGAMVNKAIPEDKRALSVFLEE